ncbi:Copper transporter [Aspergillus sp. HF37]|nr:Copper transporter [Aspergillus sp. HF37]
MNMDQMNHSGMGNSGMDMSSSSSSSSSSMGMGMAMTFSNTHNTPLYSTLWTPSSDGAYAGTCIFLIILGMLDRGLFAFKAIMERRWLAAHLERRSIVVAGKTPEAGRINADPDAKVASLVTAEGTQESVKVVQRATIPEPLPWRFSADLPRALIVLCITGVSYLLMLAVMTMNVGYFCSTLAGVFLGELGVGRFIQWNDHYH